MDPHLARCRDGLARVVAGFSPEIANRPRDGKWSIAGVLEHLDLAYTVNAAAIERRVREHTSSATTMRPKTTRERLLQFVIVTLGRFPHGRQAPEAVVPTGRLFTDVAAGLDAHLVVLDARLNDAQRAFGASRLFLKHPILGPFSVADWRRFHWIHTRHHLKQIRL